MKRWLRHALSLCFALAMSVLTACRAEPPGEALPEVSGLSDQQVLGVLAERAELVERVMSSGTMRIETADGDSVRLDIALLAASDGRLRLRAWKLGRAVFDLTRIGDELWFWSAQQDASTDRNDAISTLPTAEQLDIGWRLVSGEFFRSPPSRVISDEAMTVIYPLAQGNQQSPTASARLTIDRKTQTVRTITIDDSDGRVHAVYEPSRYRLIQGIAWATRVKLDAPDLSLQITLDEVELNGELPAAAFTPPRDARKLP